MPKTYDEILQQSIEEKWGYTPDRCPHCKQGAIAYGNDTKRGDRHDDCWVCSCSVCDLEWFQDFNPLRLCSVAFNEALEVARKSGGWWVLQQSQGENSPVSFFDETDHPDCKLTLFRNMASRRWSDTIHAAVVVDGVVMAIWHYEDGKRPAVDSSW